VSAFIVVLAPAAESDISDSILWYREKNALAADGFRAEVLDIIEHIADAPPLGRPADEDGNRNRVLKRFSYSVLYDVIGSTVTVMAVAHHRRRPNYWSAVRR
jgi:toxin ParE1/3/4